MREKTAMEGGILAWIVFGLIAGVIAKLLMPGSDPGGCIITMLLGVAGALLGGFLGRAIGIYSPGDPAGIIMAVLGAIVILVGYRMVLRPST
ncbi:MAG: GlsB/YeaQ/YmgE family stress response membrane protein [Vicinamibacteria bacterium]